MDTIWYGKDRLADRINECFNNANIYNWSFLTPFESNYRKIICIVRIRGRNTIWKIGSRSKRSNYRKIELKGVELSAVDCISIWALSNEFTDTINRFINKIHYKQIYYLIKIRFLAVWFTTVRVPFNQIHYKQLQM